MAGCGGTRWGTEQWLFVCCSFLLAVIIAPPPLKMASRHSIMQFGTHVHTFMLPQECIHAPATCLWWEDVWFFFHEIWKWVPCYLLFLAMYKWFSTSENVYDFVTSFFLGSGHYLAGRCTTVLVRKVKTDRLQNIIGHVATPPQGVGSAWGKDLAPPERPGVRAVRAVPGAGTDTQRPLSCLPPPLPSLSNSFKQLLTSFLTHRQSNLPFFPLFSPHLKSRGSILGQQLKKRWYNVFAKFL